jgi:hypothetical protein
MVRHPLTKKFLRSDSFCRRQAARRKTRFLSFSMARRNFRNETGMCHSDKEENVEQVGVDVPGSLTGKQGNRASRADSTSFERRCWLAKAVGSARPTGLRFSSRKSGRFCRRLLLAWVPQMLQQPENQPRFLGKKICLQQNARQVSKRSVTQTRLEGSKNLAAFSQKKPEELPSSHSACFAKTTLIKLEMASERSDILRSSTRQLD